MIEALLGLVPIFGFELTDDSERPRTSHRQKLVAEPQELGFCMGRTRLGASAAQKGSRGSNHPGGYERSLARTQNVRTSGELGDVRAPLLIAG